MRMAVVKSRRPLRRRGLGQDEDYVTSLGAELAYLPSFPSSLWQNLTTGTLSPAQAQAIKDQTYINNAQAATDPLTGEVNQALLDQANAQSDAEIDVATNVSGQSTGSVLADLWDTAQGTGPGFWASLGLGSGPSAPNTPNWTSILQTVAIIAVVGVSGYLIVKAL